MEFDLAPALSRRCFESEAKLAFVFVPLACTRVRCFGFELHFNASEFSCADVQTCRRPARVVGSMAGGGRVAKISFSTLFSTEPVAG